MNVESPVINVESQASDVKFCVEYVDLMLSCTRGSRGIVVDLRGIVVDLRATRVPRAWD